MADLSPQIKDQIVASLEQQKVVIGDLFGLTFDVEITVDSVAEVDLGEGDFPEAARGPGLVLMSQVDSYGFLALLPSNPEITPDWCRNPDGKQQDTLRGLAKELSKAVLPESCAPADPAFGHVDDLSKALARGDIDPSAATWIALTLKRETSETPLFLVWPARSPAEILPPMKAPEGDSSNVADAPPPGASASPALSRGQAAAESAPLPQLPPQMEPPNTVYYRDMDEGIALLPPYSRSLLKVEVPVTVKLASTTQPVSRILELSPGTIIQFDKPCDDTLTLEVGGQPVAVGEAVKVGDKFGLLITSMAMPEERFWVMSPNDESTRAK